MIENQHKREKQNHRIVQDMWVWKTWVWISAEEAYILELGTYSMREYELFECSRVERSRRRSTSSL